MLSQYLIKKWASNSSKFQKNSVRSQTFLFSDLPGHPRNGIRFNYFFHFGTQSKDMKYPSEGWSNEEVLDWTKNFDKETQAHIEEIMKREKIDGKMLLNSTSIDFHRYGMKLGPANKILMKLEELKPNPVLGKFPIF